MRGELRVNPGLAGTMTAKGDLMVRWAVALMFVFFGALQLPASAGAAEPGPGPRGGITTVVGGSWVGLANCVFTSFDPATGDFVCIGSTSWEGSWTGITHYDLTGNFNPVTGDWHGTITETFTGTSLADKSTGSLNLQGSLTVEGATQAVHVEEDIIDGDGDRSFRCSSGHATFDGLADAVGGMGGYHGSWTHGC
jgi:hypothetical protein